MAAVTYDRSTRTPRIVPESKIPRVASRASSSASHQATEPSALAAKPLPVQLGFLDAPAEPPMLRLAVIGLMQRSADVRLGTEGSVHLVLKVKQPADGLALLAVYRAPAEQRIELEQLAKSLPAGAAVLLRGQGLALASHAGSQVLQLVRCESVHAVTHTFEGETESLPQPSNWITQ